MDERFPRSEITGRVIGAAQEMHRQLGLGFCEILYRRAWSRSGTIPNSRISISNA